MNMPNVNPLSALHAQVEETGSGKPTTNYWQTVLSNPDAPHNQLPSSHVPPANLRSSQSQPHTNVQVSSPGEAATCATPQNTHIYHNSNHSSRPLLSQNKPAHQSSILAENQEPPKYVDHYPHHAGSPQLHPPQPVSCPQEEIRSGPSMYITNNHSSIPDQELRAAYNLSYLASQPFATPSYSQQHHNVSQSRSHDLAQCTHQPPTSSYLPNSIPPLPGCYLQNDTTRQPPQMTSFHVHASQHQHVFKSAGENFMKPCMAPSGDAASVVGPQPSSVLEPIAHQPTAREQTLDSQQSRISAPSPIMNSQLYTITSPVPTLQCQPPSSPQHNSVIAPNQIVEAPQAPGAHHIATPAPLFSTRPVLGGCTATANQKYPATHVRASQDTERAFRPWLQADHAADASLDYPGCSRSNRSIPRSQPNNVAISMPCCPSAAHQTESRQSTIRLLPDTRAPRPASQRYRSVQILGRDGSTSDALIPDDSDNFGADSAVSDGLLTMVSAEPFTAESGNIGCSKCREQFGNIHSWKRHATRKHSSLRQASVKCQECSVDFRNDGNLRRHMRTAHSIIPGHIKCEHCRATFTSERSLSLHMMKIHSRRENCDAEGTTVRGQTNRYTEVSMGTRKNGIEKAKLFKCHKCSYMSKWQGNISRHFDGVHLKLRLYPCNECDRRFNTSSNLAVHKMTHQTSGIGGGNSMLRRMNS